MSAPELKTYLERLVKAFERPAFIQDDPIAVAHGFDDPRDQEVIGLYSALLAWGRRETVLTKMATLCDLMDWRPYEFVMHFDRGQLSDRLADFKHRTFQPLDAIWFTRNLSTLIMRWGSVEKIFAGHMSADSRDIAPAIEGFSRSIMMASAETPARLRKHLARPRSGSACKRLCMYLRWMVRRPPVDLGIWTMIQPAQLVLPLDVHSGRQARALGMLTRKADDWKSAIELTGRCREFCPEDPARYDYAFFGLGAYGDPTSGSNP